MGFSALGFAHPVQAIPSALAVGLGLVALARRACVRPLRGLKGLASRAAASSCSMHLLRLRAGSQLPDGLRLGLGPDWTAATLLRSASCSAASCFTMRLISFFRPLERMVRGCEL